MIDFPDSLCIVDFETAGIRAYPDYPPKPCGVALRWESGSTEYLAWGHEQGNNVKFEEAKRAVARAFKYPCAFHNAAFDMEVARVHLGLPYPAEWHDTMLMAFLCEPHAPSIGLKPLGELLLGEAPDAKDALIEWGMANLKLPKSQVMANVPLIPASVVGPYAQQDVRLTFKLARNMWERMNKHNLWDAYRREKRLLPWLLDSERRGTRVDRVLLMKWQEQLSAALPAADAHIYAHTKQIINLDANEEFADGLERAGLVDPDKWPRTATGARSVSLPVLKKLLPPALFDLIAYRNKTATMLRTFVGPWLELSAADGRLHTGWSSTRNPEGKGTRTGRIASSRPNLANIPNEQKAPPPPGLPDLPLLRRAMLPEVGHLWVSGDYSQQELRLLAHFEDNDLRRAYEANAQLDLHQYAADLIKDRVGLVIDRKGAKILGFSIIYGAGAFKIAEQLGCSTDEALTLRSAYLSALPGVYSLQDETRGRFRTGRPLRTLGGRTYFCEPPSKGRTYEYKGLNVLIQGSAADQTKQAIIDYCTHAPDSCLLTTVYDEINVSVPEGEVLKGARKLQQAMTGALPLDVPVLVDLEVGPNWADMEPVKVTR